MGGACEWRSCGRGLWGERLWKGHGERGMGEGRAVGASDYVRGIAGKERLW